MEGDARRVGGEKRNAMMEMMEMQYSCTKFSKINFIKGSTGSEADFPMLVLVEVTGPCPSG